MAELSQETLLVAYISYGTVGLAFLGFLVQFSWHFCSIRGKKASKGPSQSLKKRVSRQSSDFVGKIGVGEVMQFNVKKNDKFATPSVEALIPEDEYVLKAKRPEREELQVSVAAVNLGI